MEAPAQHTPTVPRCWVLCRFGVLVEALPRRAPADANDFARRIILFSAGCGHPPGIPLAALTTQPGAAPEGALFDPLEPAFDPSWGVSTKIAVVMNSNGVEYRRQVPARRTIALAPSISKGKLLATLAREVQLFLVFAAARGAPLRHNGADVLLRELVICGLRQISRGSWTPLLAIVVG